MFFAVYVSSAVQLFNDEGLTALLKESRENNARASVTGMLLYRDGNFMQFLEGPKDKVCALLERIKLDPRHRGMIVLLQQDHADREFSEWSMGFQRLNGEKMPEVPGYSDFLDLPLTSDEFLMHPSKSLSLLLSFRKNMR
jgi:hypothetical protein